MRQPRNQLRGQDRPLVGIAVDGVTGYGRAVMRGAMRYANLQRRWIIHEQMKWGAGSVSQFPRCEGVIVAGIGDDAGDGVRRRCKHMVLCSGDGDPQVTPVVCLDDYNAGEMAAQHLLECQLENFGYLGRVDKSVSKLREAGFINTLTNQGFKCDTAPVDWSQVPANPKLRTKLSSWLRDLPKPVGIMAIDDSAAHFLAGVCLKQNLHVPEQIAIVGVNNDDLSCESAWPPLSSVEGDFSRMGYAAASLLDRMLAGETLRGEDRLIRLPPLGVVKRMSTDILAVNDPYVADALQFIRAHACDPCTVPDVLDHVPVNRRWLERQFIQKLARSPHDEIIRVRMQTAKRLLLQLELTLPDVAYRCGFTAVSTFGQTFRKVFGITPGDFRRTSLRFKK